MKFAMPSRKEIGIRTIFNILGPLTNPANASSQVVGVFDENLTNVIAEVLNNLGVAQAFVVHGMDGLDEITISTKTKITHVKDKMFNTYYLDPSDFGFQLASKDVLVSSNISQSVEITREILKDKKKGPQRDIVLLNSAAAIVAGGCAKNFAEGVKIAGHSIDSGKAFEKLEQLVSVSNIKE